MKNKETAQNYNALYRKQHWFAIALKNQMYKHLEHIKQRRREDNRRRKGYFKKYYEANKTYFQKKTKEWVKNNPDRRKHILKRYAEKLKRRKKRKNMKAKIERVIAEYLDYCAHRYDEATLVPYKRNINRFLQHIDSYTTRRAEYHNRHYQEMQKPEQERDFSWTKEYIRIQYAEQLDRDFITRYVAYVNHDEVNETTKQPLSQSEKESRLYPLKSFLWYCLRKGYIRKDLRKYIIVPPREKKVLKEVLTQDEMTRLLDAPDIHTSLGIRNRTLLELSYSGLRTEEMLELKLKEVDIVTNTVTILDGKGNKDRVVPMTQECIYWMKIWFDKRKEMLKDDIAYQYVFISKNKKPLHRRNFSTLIKKYAKRAGLNIDVPPHDLRRTTATHLVENGAPIRLIQALLGHATLQVTTKYLRLSDEKIKKEHKQTHPSNRRSLYYGDIKAKIY